MESPELIRRQASLSFSDPWISAVNHTATIRPDSLRALYDRFDLPTGWATLPYEPPTAADYELIDVIDLDNDQDWWTETDVQKHYDSMEGPSQGRVDKLIRQKATAVGAAFRRT
ncbi:hypothetical protein R0K19_21590, partial [Bacillus sp. SIMBA_161]